MLFPGCWEAQALLRESNAKSRQVLTIAPGSRRDASHSADTNSFMKNKSRIKRSQDRPAANPSIDIRLLNRRVKGLPLHRRVLATAAGQVQDRLSSVAA